MSLRCLARQGPPPRVSFEFFPPRTAEMEAQFWRAIRRLEPLQPAFISVTHGAGGSAHRHTHDILRRVIAETTLKPAAHLTCACSPRSQVEEIAQSHWDAGVRHIVALRGDTPEPEQPYAPHPDGYQSTPEFISGLCEIAPFEISVSAYPERHPDSPTLEHDLDLLKRKVDAGATRALTQFGFYSESIARFRDRAVAAGIHIPIVPGVIPTTNIGRIARMAGRSGVVVPSWLTEFYQGLNRDPETRRLIAATILAEQVKELNAEGFDQFHFYTLNQADLAYATCRMLGLHETTEKVPEMESA